MDLFINVRRSSGRREGPLLRLERGDQDSHARHGAGAGTLSHQCERFSSGNNQYGHCSSHILRVVEAERKQELPIPWGRMGTGEDLVDSAAIFLASSDSDYMAGATVLVDGGCLAGSVLPRFRAPRG